MSEWTWQFENNDGARIDLPTATRVGFPSQADAETWIGESWRTLLDSGVEQVVLYQSGTEVYGPMSLRPTN